MKTSIIFFGTHDFAAVILETLLASDVVTVKAIVTQPDKPVGRAQKLEAPTVKQRAESKKFKAEILQPATLKDKTIQQKLAAFGADIFIVVEYGKLIPQDILDIPSRGTINVHPSLLPRYRGPSPIQQALVDGATHTGTSIMLLDADMDHGPILAQEKVAIDPNDTFPTLRTKLADKSAQLLIKTLPGYIDGSVKPKEQDHKKATFTKLFEREDGRINWNKSAEEIHNLWRGLSPWPGVFTEIKKDGTKVRIKLIKMQLDSSALADGNDGMKGEPKKFIIEKRRLFVCTATTPIELLEVQPEGKKPLTSAEFINGFAHYLTA